METDKASRAGPLSDVRILEFTGLGPTPFGTMLLADLGAEVLRIDRIGAANPLGGMPKYNFLFRGRPSVAIDLKSEAGCNLVRDLARQADVVIEGFRPGAMERLGLGPDNLCALNERLIYARMSGWGQAGPLADKAGHDINYLAMTGGLYPMGPHDEPPSPPLNLVGNFGGGGTFLAIGVLAALNERQCSGRGQVVDVAMIDGISVLLTQMASWMQMGQWNAGRGGNLLDGSAYFYRCYATSDGRHIAVGALEPHFHDAFINGLGLEVRDFGDHLDPEVWPARCQRVATIVASRSLDEWIDRFKKIDACVSAVLTFDEAVAHPANRDRGVHTISANSVQPSAAPRFSRTPSRTPDGVVAGSDFSARLASWSERPEEITRLRREGIIGII